MIRPRRLINGVSNLIEQTQAALFTTPFPAAPAERDNNSYSKVTAPILPEPRPHPVRPLQTSVDIGPFRILFNSRPPQKI